MSLTLHLGVLEQYYGTGKGTLSTYDVAKFLEQRYALMATFYGVKEQAIANLIAESLAGSLESLLGGRVQINPYAAATQQIETMFRDFIATKEAERVGIPGTPTKASGGTPDRIGGINHRLAHPYSKRNPRRPSFRDTGLFMSSFKSWVDGQ